MRKRWVPAALLALVTLVGCSRGATTEDAANGPTTTAYDPLASLRLRINQSFTQYVERAISERPELTRQRPGAEVLSCAVATSREIAETVFLSRISQLPTTTVGQSETAEVAINEATSAAQAQIESVLAGCAQGG